MGYEWCFYMDKEWSEKNKKMQRLISAESTFADGIKCLIELREIVFTQISEIINGIPEKAFSELVNERTLAFSIWHTFRIEDIVIHNLILNDEQEFFKGRWQKKIQSKIISTANELNGNEFVEFSKPLNIKELYNYAVAVKNSTNEMLKKIEYKDLKRTFSEEDKRRIEETGSVSYSDEAYWLIDFWCKKNIAGLIKMPLSRHWIMHVEEMRRIKNKLCKKARAGVNPVAYCGFSCNHCFLSEWCGSCRTEYNCCSFATCSPDRKCANVVCCKSKGLEGCYECSEIEFCKLGFYVEGNDGAAAAKAQALFMAKHGRKDFLKMQDLFHQKYQFAKTQEILGQDVHKGLEILEKIWEERKK